MEADFQLAAWQRSGEIQASFSNDSDQLVLGCDLVVQFCHDTFVRRFLGSVNAGILRQIAAVPEVAGAVSSLIGKANEDIAYPYLLTAVHNPLSRSVFQGALNLGAGTQLLRRQLYYFILKRGNDYCSPMRQGDLLAVLRIILGLDRTSYSGSARGISYGALLRLLRDHGEDVRKAMTACVPTGEGKKAKKMKRLLGGALQLADPNQFALALLNQLLEKAGTASLSAMLEFCQQLYPECFSTVAEAPQEAVPLEALSPEQETILRHQLEYMGAALEELSDKKKAILVKNVKKCNAGELIPIFAENAERLAELACVPADQLRAELEADPLAPFRYFAVTRLLKLQKNQQTQSLDPESEEQLLAAFNDSPQLQAQEDAAVLRWLRTGDSSNPEINAKLEAFLRTSENPETAIVLGALDQLAADGVVGVDMLTQLKTEYSGRFCGDPVYADIFAQTVTLYRSTPVYCLASDEMVQLDRYLTDYCSAQNGVWLRRCDRLRREVVPAALDEARSRILFGEYKNWNKIWTIPGLLKSLGFVLRYAELRDALPPGSVCVVVGTHRSGKF